MTSRHVINATCPECRGPLTAVQHDEMVEYECLVGHRYSANALLHAYATTQERALWSAVVALEEATNLVNGVAPHLPSEVRPVLKLEADQKARQAEKIREILSELSPFRTG